MTDAARIAEYQEKAKLWLHAFSNPKDFERTLLIDSLAEKLAAHDAALTAEVERLKEDADFLRESVGECHLMLSRGTTEFQTRHDWDLTSLPHRFRKALADRDAALAEAAKLLQEVIFELQRQSPPPFAARSEG